ncbi:MAG: signal peptidase I, partial [Acidobacteria bacterium]|nr:signal peptidase I [Acidobacteriota bacterium]
MNHPAASHASDHAIQAGWPSSLQSLAVTIVIALFIITFLAQAFQIPSESMESTLLTGDYLLVDKVHFAEGGVWEWALPYHGVRRGDIVVFRYPVRPTEHFVKRVVALPGDHVRLQDKRLRINGRPLEETYVQHTGSGRDPFRDNFPAADYFSFNVESRWWVELRASMRNGEVVVPPGKYFVLGDNRDHSLDSRYWGFVPRENIVGRPLLIYWSVADPPPYDED